MELILATADGREEGFIPFDADIEIGGSNTFEIGVPRAAWEGSLTFGKRVYIPGTEYGGTIGELETMKDPEYVYVRGRTWRGALQKKVISPPFGQDYYIVAGELNTCIRQMINAFFADDLIIGSDADTGISVTYQVPRYIDLLSGIEGMLKTVGYRPAIRYMQTENGGNAVVDAEPVENYSSDIEISDDAALKINADDKRNGVNHLICLGQGELQDRIVVHIYADQYGNITNEQVLFGQNEVAEVYENTGAETAEELRTYGLERMAEVAGGKTMQATVGEIETELQIGDIISGREFLTNIYLEKPIEKKILKIIGEIETVEYGLEGEDA